ncbi:MULTISPECIES: Uma2 family endonuclease [Spirulina sp. CCY15215]|uniref:Uma2 family endonuclease n=1 Tax=Spirulina sp. CCY15215 TaxID=2767591 RepID=UPI001951E360|nr:Uma2 family endonuclease [Spirulina major]
MIVATQSKYFTPEEYLELEEQAEFKNEYLDGEIVPMAGATANHNKISLNFCRSFPLSIDEKDYDIFMSDMRLWIPSYRRYTYPDVMMTDGEPIFTDEKQTAIINPCLIVEILSRSTKDYDKTDKFKKYRSIASFQEYILISQTSYNVEQYTKQKDGRWLLTEYLEEDSILKLEAVNFEIALKDLYKRVNFDLGR